MTLSSTPEHSIRVAVSTVIFSVRKENGKLRLSLPLVRRIRNPFQGQLALPGGWLQQEESIADAAARTLAETTGLNPSYLEQLYAFGAVERSPERAISIIYWALIRDDGKDLSPVTQNSNNVAWFSTDQLPKLAFDHNEIIEYALWRLRNKVGYSRIAHGLLPEHFTLAELREIYETILDKKLDPANFRRQVEATGTLTPTNEFRTGKGRPARLYHYDRELELAERGPLNRNNYPTAKTES